MINSNVYQLFDVFTKTDIRQLKKVVRSPFFNQREHVARLFDYFSACKYDKREAPNREGAFQYLFPKETYDDHKLRLSMSLLLKAMEQYLIWKEVNENKEEASLALVKAYRKLKLSKHFNKSITTARKLQQDSSWRHAEFFQNEYALHLEQYRYDSAQSRLKGLNLQPIQENLDIAYMTAKLRQICFALSHQVIYKSQYSMGMLSGILVHIEQYDYVRVPAIAVYYYCYRALVAPSEPQYFEQFRSLIFEHQHIFPGDEIRDLFLLATNYCIRQMNQGKREYAAIGLGIYKEGLESKALLLNGYLSRFTYRNIVAKSIIAREFDWVASFMDLYKDYLEPKHRESIYAFNRAWLEYERRNYDLALEYINQANFNDLLLNLSAKTIALKIYYELQAFDLLYSHLDAMKIFIIRQKTLSYHKRNYLNTIRFTKKMLDIAPSNDKAIQALRSKIEATTAVAEKNWLLSQL